MELSNTPFAICCGCPTNELVLQVAGDVCDDIAEELTVLSESDPTTVKGFDFSKLELTQILCDLTFHIIFDPGIAGAPRAFELHDHRFSKRGGEIQIVLSVFRRKPPHSRKV